MTTTHEENQVLLEEGECNPSRNQSYGSISTNVDRNGNIDGDYGKPQKLTVQAFISLVIICGVTFFCGVNFSIVAPIFPPSAEKKGMPTVVVGLVVGLYNLIIFITSPVYGLILTRVGAKFLFVAGSIFTGICGILFGVVDYGPDGLIYIIMCFVTRAFQALGSAAYETAAFSLIARKFPERVTFVFGLLETSSGIGMMIGPALGGSLFQIGGYYLPFSVCGAALVLSGAISFFIFTPINDSHVPNKKSMCSYILHPGTLTLLNVVVIMAISLTFLEPVYSQYLAQFGLQPYQVGLIFVIIPAIYAVMGPVYGYIGDKKGCFMSLMIGGCLILGVSYSFMGPAPIYSIKPTMWIVIVSNVLVGIFIGTTFVPVFPALIITAFEAGYPDNFDTCGLVSGAILSAFALGGFIGATFAGMLVDAIGFEWSTLVISWLYVFSAVTLIIYAAVKWRKTKGDTFDRKRALRCLELSIPVDVPA